jgi:hypothetical protein
VKEKNAPAVSPPRISTNFVEPHILHKIQILYSVIYIRVQKFPKKDRYTLGVRIENTILEIIELLILATGKHGASQGLILNKADVLLKVLRMMIRIANKVHALPEMGFIEISEQMIEIGKMLGGWIKTTKSSTHHQSKDEME